MSTTILTHSTLLFNLGLLAVILLSKKNKPAYLLALLVLVPTPFLITHLIFALWGYTPLTVQTIFFSSAISPLFGPVLLFYVESIIAPRKPLLRLYNVRYVLHCLVPFGYWLRYTLFSEAERWEYCQRVVQATDTEFIVFDLLFICHFFVFVPLCYQRIRQYKHSLDNFFSYEQTTRLDWLLQLIRVSFWLNMFGLVAQAPVLWWWSQHLLAVMNVVVAANVFVFFGFIIYQAVAASRVTDALEIASVESQEKTEIPLEIDEILAPSSEKELPVFSDEQVQKVMMGFEKERLYLLPTLKLKDFADRVSLPAHMVSAIMNQQFGKNFFDFVNEFRVEHACLLINDANMMHFSIEGIGFESGFNSKTAFFRAFKKSKNMSPLEYKRQIASDSALISTTTF